MLTPARLREYTGESGALDLLRALGYPVSVVDIDPLEWKRGGVHIPWNGQARLRLAARMRHFDLFLLTGTVSEEEVLQFLNSYSAYNQITKSAVFYQHDDSVTIFDLDTADALRRFEVDLTCPSAHAIDRLNLLTRGEDAALPRIFDRALDRESVTRQFFQRFRTAVRDVAEALAGSFPGEERTAVDDEALLILSRLLFLSFIQEKGWLGGERRFLVDRLARETARGGEFFSDVLLPLFFGCLNTPLAGRSLAARALGRIPYLNGGLFEPSAFERRHEEIHLPNELLRRVIEEVFERFDFRIDEGTAGGTHVDPEMLGKVFESLMAADERASSGSFYTPKEIVDVLTERAIREWLGPAPSLEQLDRITILDPACGSGAFLLSALAAIERIWKSLTGNVPQDLRRRVIARSLYGVDLKPEAVRLCELRLWLAIVSGTGATIETMEPLPNLDRNILQGNSLLSPTDFLGDARRDIYAQWLDALRAQRDLIERYRSAPHADRPALQRLIRGNDQRLASVLLCRGIDAAELELQHACAPQRDLFGRALSVDADLCRSLQQRLSMQRRLLEDVEEGRLDFFSFDIHFASVMAAGGFDVVAGNPPWVRSSRIDGQLRRMLSDRYPFFRGQRQGGGGFHQPDLSLAFFDRSLSLASPQGVVALLMPAKLLNAGYASGLRQAVRDRLVALEDWSDDPRRKRWFDADTFPLGVLLRKSAVSQPLSVTVSGQAFEMDQRDLSLASPGEWSLLPPDVLPVLRRLRSAHPSLEKALARKPFMGVKTGDNRSFFLDVRCVGKSQLITTDGIRIPLSAVCRCVRGRDLHAWSVSRSHWMLWPPAKGWSDPPVWLKKLAAARGMEPEEYRLSFVKPEHAGIKVAWKDLSRGLAAAVLPDAVYVGEQSFPLIPNQTLYALDAVALDEAYAIAAVLNSTIVGALLVSVAERAKDSHYRYFGKTIGALPWPDLTPVKEQLVRLSRRAHRGAHVMAEVDELVAGLYGVSNEEAATLEGFLMRRLGAC